MTVTVSGEGGSAVTGSDGRFIRSNVPAGLVTLRAALAGYLPAARAVVVEAGQTVAVPLALSP